MSPHLAGGSPLFLSLRRSIRTDDTTGTLSSRMFVRYGNGDLVIISPLPGGYQEIEDMFASGEPPLKYKAYRGLYIVREYEPAPNGKPVPGTEMRIQFPVPPEDMPEPCPGVSWRGTIIKQFDDGTVQRSSMEIGFSRGQAIDLGATTYGVIRADLVFDRGTDRRMDVRYLYLPALRTALFVSSRIACDRPLRLLPIGLDEAH